MRWCLKPAAYANGCSESSATLRGSERGANIVNCIDLCNLSVTASDHREKVAVDLHDACSFSCEQPQLRASHYLLSVSIRWRSDIPAHRSLLLAECRLKLNQCDVQVELQLGSQYEVIFGSLHPSLFKIADAPREVLNSVHA